MKLSSGKLQFLKWNKPPVGACRNLLSLAHTGILHSFMPGMFSGLRNKTFCCADAGRFCKSLKIKTQEKLPEIHLMEQGNTGLRYFQQQ
jgi:hypothetical protein